MAENDPTSKKYPFLDPDDSDDATDAPDGPSDASHSEPTASDLAADASDATEPDVPDARDVAPADASVDDLHFSDDDVGEALRHAEESELNGVNFGIIQVDDDGVVQFFNRYESELSGVSPDEAEGRNFFTQVAPCTNNRLFRGRFKKGVRRGELDETFTYTYTYKMRPTLVDVHLYRDDGGHNWIMVQKY